MDLLDILSQNNYSTDVGTYSIITVCIQITGECGIDFPGEITCVSGIMQLCLFGYLYLFVSSL